VHGVLITQAPRVEKAETFSAGTPSLVDMLPAALLSSVWCVAKGQWINPVTLTVPG
jgi:hypothetical protein